ncbi:MAG: hypothetical protein JWL69_3183 [Phycisphaerales bacterium]|nr:hypothetical protein [Phycisphaerales bacterium]
MRGFTSRTGTALAGMLAAVVLFAGATTRAADERRQLDELIQALKQKGVAVQPADFSTEPVPAADDAAPALLAAAKLVKARPEPWKALEQISERLPASPQLAEVYRNIVASDSEALALADQALVRKAADWKVTVTSPVIRVMLPHLNGQRDVANLLRVAAFDAYTRGDHRQAVNHVRELLALGRLLDRQPFIVSHLVAIGVGALTYDCIYQMAPDLKIESGGSLDPKAATAEQMRGLIAELNDEKVLHDGLNIALQSERMSELDVAGALIAGTIKWEELAGPAVAPGQAPVPEPQDLKSVAVRDTKLMSEHMALMETAVLSADYPTFQKQKPPEPRNADQGPLARLAMPALDRTVRQQYRALTERRMAAAVLAVRWFCVDSGGKFPARLADVSPRYLQAVPLDPMALKQPLTYKPDAKVLYSVGEDGIDNGGSERPKDPARNAPWFLQDYVIHLTRE